MPQTTNREIAKLAVRDGRICDAATGESVVLRGVNLSGFEYARDACVTGEEVERIGKHWEANIIRLPFNQKWALEDEAYRQSLDEVVALTASEGMYTLLDLHWLDAETSYGTNSRGKPNFVPPLPNARSLSVWSELAARYRGQPSVLFDIFNEPHDVLMQDWQPWAIRLVETIWREQADAVVLVPGVDWGFDLRGFPLPGKPVVVYTTHVYRNKGNFRKAGCNALREAGHAVFASEWGGCTEDVKWGAQLADYFDELRMGWTAWSWRDWSYLIEREADGAGDATPFGQLVQARLRRQSPSAA